MEIPESLLVNTRSYRLWGTQLRVGGGQICGLVPQCMVHHITSKHNRFAQLSTVIEQSAKMETRTMTGFDYDLFPGEKGLFY